MEIGYLAELYLDIKKEVIKKGFASEIAWQKDIELSKITEHDFVREAAWVILSSGMRESVIRQKFPAVSAAFYNWEDSKKIAQNANKCRDCALLAFGNRQKINAIISVVEQVSTCGFANFKVRLETDGIEFIQSLPFMGPATSYHLAKNIGLDVVKPDRHLMRVAAVTGYHSPKLLCEEIAKDVGDRISVVDLVIWRFATLEPHYIDYFR